jgi:hypothetical protein
MNYCLHKVPMTPYVLLTACVLLTIDMLLTAYVLPTN